jgi:hypothetical protein
MTLIKSVWMDLICFALENSHALWCRLVVMMKELCLVPGIAVATVGERGVRHWFDNFVSTWGCFYLV